MLNAKVLFFKTLTNAFTALLVLALTPSAFARLNPEDPNLGTNGAGYLEQSAGQRSASSMDSLLSLAGAIMSGLPGSFGQNSSSDALVGKDQHVSLGGATSPTPGDDGEGSDDIEK